MHISTIWKSFQKCSRSLAVALMLAGSSLYANAVEQTFLTIIFQDGTKQSYTLNDRPKVTFDKKTLFVKAQEVENSYELKNVNKFVFTPTSETGVSKVAANEYRFTFTDGVNVVLEGHTSGTAVRVCDITGKTVVRTAADAEGRAVVSLEGLGNGIYVVSTADGKSYKVTKR